MGKLLPLLAASNLIDPPVPRRAQSVTFGFDAAWQPPAQRVRIC